MACSYFLPLVHYKCDRGLRFVCSSYKSITIRCAKCQIFGVWHTKHQKILLMRCSKSYKFWHTWTILFDLWNNIDRCAKKNIHFLSLLLLLFFLLSLTFSFFFLRLFLISYHSLFPFSSSFFSASSPHGFGFFFFPFTFSAPLSLSFIYFFLSLYLSLSLSLSLSLLSIAFIADLHSSRPIPFTTSHLVMTKSWFASTITPSPSLSTLVSTKKKAISIRYSRMCLRDSGG